LLEKSVILLDYLALTKPRVILLHLIAAASAMFLAAGQVPPADTLIFTLLGGALVAGAANVLNCYFDRDLDGIMPRTRRRPLVADRLKPYQALVFAALLGVVGLFILGRFISLTVAALALGALAYYDIIYTLWLKRRTYWSSIIGSGAGAFPPLIGWVAVTGQISLVPFLLAAVIILWTPSHFWSLAISRREEYTSAGLEVLPAGHAERWIFFSSLLLVVVTIVLGIAAGSGILYFLVAALLGLGLLLLASILWHKEDPKAGRRLFYYSLLYLGLLFAAIVTDTLL
jgi:protoheme IX farnesyltransferase